MLLRWPKRLDGGDSSAVADEAVPASSMRAVWAGRHGLCAQRHADVHAGQTSPQLCATTSKHGSRVFKLTGRVEDDDSKPPALAGCSTNSRGCTSHLLAYMYAVQAGWWGPGA